MRINIHGRALLKRLYLSLQLVLLLVLLCPLMNAKAESPPLLLPSMDHGYSTLGHLDYWVANRALTPDEVATLSAEQKIKFTPLTKMAVPRRDHDIWFKLKLKGTNDLTNHVYLNFHDFIYKKIAVYQKDSAGQWQGTETGTNYPYTQREIAYRHFAFGISLEKDETKEVLILLNSMYQRRFLPIIEPDILFFKGSINHTLVSALIIGVVIGTFIYMLIVGGSSRSRHFISLYLFLLLAILNMLYFSGFIYALIPDQVKIHQGLAITLNATLIYTGVQFSRVLFEFDRDRPIIRYFIWLYTIIVLIVIHIAMLDLPESVYILNDYYLVPIGILVMFFAGIYGLTKGNRYAPVFVIGVFLYLTTNAFYYNTVITGDNFRWDIHIYEFSTCLMLIFLASTVILRIRADRKKNELTNQNN
jgi:hypothetical protein